MSWIFEETAPNFYCLRVKKYFVWVVDVVEFYDDRRNVNSVNTIHPERKYF